MSPTVLALLSLSVAPPQDGGLLASEWRLVLESPGGELPFRLNFARDEERTSAWIHNGEERIPSGPLERKGDHWLLNLEPYDSRLVFRVSDDGALISGHWEKSLGGERQARLPLRGSKGGEHRFPLVAVDSEQRSRLAGRWAVRFSSDEDLAIGTFACNADGTAAGTFETTLGDYRFLAGAFDGERLRLSCFDGGHAFLFDARLRADGSLEGDFWSRDSWHETWTATKDPDAELPDPFGLTTWTDAVPLSELRFPDLLGEPRSLAEETFSGRARIITLFGTWCPNCNDEASFLRGLHERYAKRGLSILGLAFELDDDFERSVRQVQRFRERHALPYPVLIAGVADKKEASRAFPALDRVRAYPTAILLDGDGKVRAIHTGFSGPATGAAHEHQRERYELLLEDLLAEGRSK